MTSRSCYRLRLQLFFLAAVALLGFIINTTCVASRDIAAAVEFTLAGRNVSVVDSIRVKPQ